MWPEPVERIAAFLRASGSEGRLEELLTGEDTAPGLQLAAAGFDCEGRSVVALVAKGRTIDAAKLAAAAGCRSPRPGVAPGFPYEGALVLVDREALTAPTVWLDAGAPQHVVGLAPAQLLRLTRSRAADLLQES